MQDKKRKDSSRHMLMKLSELSNASLLDSVNHLTNSRKVFIQALVSLSLSLCLALTDARQHAGAADEPSRCNVERVPSSESSGGESRDTKLLSFHARFAHPAFPLRPAYSPRRTSSEQPRRTSSEQPRRTSSEQHRQALQ
jgi:hypothetical protein